MRDILEICRVGHTADEVTRMISKRHKLSFQSVYPSVLAFLKRMHRLGVITPCKRNTEAKQSLKPGLKVRDTFGAYTILEEIGRNSNVIVYKCTSKGDKKDLYTLKLLTDRDDEDAFMREYQILKTIPPHPNIRRCLAAGTHDGIPYLLFEYVEGKTLSHVTGKIDLDTKIDITWQLLKAMEHLHRHNILHGDIHGSNFLIDSRNKVYVIDLGMAYGERETDVSHGGVPQYMPPERMPDHNYNFSKHKGDYTAEVFQIGICLYLLFSGNYPFEGRLLKDLRYSIQHVPPMPLDVTEKGEIIPKIVSDIIFRSLEKKPSARYKNISDMLLDWETVSNENLIEGELYK